MNITIAQGAFLPVPANRGGAVEKVWGALGREFARLGHRVTHVSRLCDSLPAENTADGVHHIRVQGYDAPATLRRRLPLDLLYAIRAARALPPADLVVTHTFWLPVLLRRPSRHGAVYVHVGRYPRWQMKLYRHAARLQTVTHAIGDAIRAIVPECAEKVAVIPYPLTPGMMLTDKAEVDSCFAARRPVVLFAGRIHPQKGMRLLIEAFERFAKSHPGWVLRLVGAHTAALGGGGETYLQEMRERAAALGSQVEFAGFTNTTEGLREHLREASIFAYPSVDDFGETFGVAPLEAMGNGCPTVVSDLGCFRDFIRDGVSGLVFDHRAADASAQLAERFSRIADGRDFAHGLARAGWEVAHDHRLERIAQLYLDDFADAIRTR